MADFDSADGAGSLPADALAMERGPASLSGIRCLGWKVMEVGVPASPQEAQVREAIFAVGNGLVGVRGYYEESEFPDRNHRNSSGVYSSSSSFVRTGAGVTSQGNSEFSSEVKPQLRGIFFAGFTEQSIVQEVGWLSCGISSKDSYLVALPDPFCINVYIGGELVSTATGRMLSHVRRLDLRTGELYRCLEWESSQHQRRVQVESTRFLSTAKQSIGVMRYTVRAQKTYNTDIRIFSYIALPTDNASSRACVVEQMFDSCDMNSSTSVVMTRTRNSCRRVAVATFEKCSWNNDAESLSVGVPFLNKVMSSARTGSSESSDEDFASENATGGPSLLRHRDQLAWSPMAPQTLHSEAGCKTVYSCCDNDNVCIDIVKYAGFFSEEDAPAEDLSEFAVSQTRLAAANGGYDALFAAQQQSMRQMWETTDVRMKTDPSVSAAYRFNVLQVLMSCCPHSLYGYPSRGLASPSSRNGYHTWEVDAIIIPFLSHVYPTKARNLLEFRCRNLHNARIHAQDMELHRGAWYPYHTVTGTDSEVPYYVAFIFLNAVIAYAMRQYVTITNDFSILFKDGGAEAVVASALVYLEWGTWDRGAFHLRSVSGPDHLSGMVDNNFFTNLMVQQHLEWAVQIASVCRKNDRRFWEELLTRNEMSEDDVAAMEKAATYLVLEFDAKSRVNAMDQFFMRKRRWNPESGTLTLSQQFKRCGHQQHRVGHPFISRHQLCCLPDVVLATMLLPEKFTSDEIKSNFNFYEPITVAWDSPISLAIFSVVAAQLRLPEKSHRYFRQALFANLNNSTGHMSEGVDCATAASSWWTLAIGFGGMRVFQGVLHFAPTLPEDCEGYQFTCRHNGCIVRVKVSRRTAKYLLVQAPVTVEELLIVHAGTSRLYMKVGVAESVKLNGEIPQYNFDGVVFDIHSLVSDVGELMFAAWDAVLTPFFRERQRTDFIFTEQMFETYLQEDIPLNGLKEICAQVHCDVEVSEPGKAVSNEWILLGLCTKRNEAFRKLVQEKGLSFRDGAFALLHQLRNAEIAVGCVAGSAYGNWVLQQYPQLKAGIDCFVDGRMGSQLNLQSRPALDYFVHCAKKLSCPVTRTILILEDAQNFFSESLELFGAAIDLKGSGTMLEMDTCSPTSPRPQQEFRQLSVRSLAELTLAALDRAATRHYPEK